MIRVHLILATDLPGRGDVLGCLLAPLVIRRGLFIRGDPEVRAVVVFVEDVVVFVEPAHFVIPSLSLVVVVVVARCWPKLPRLRLGQVGPVNIMA